MRGRRSTTPALLLGLAMLAGCRQDASPPPADGSVQPASPLAAPGELALGYAPGEDPTDRAIARAQAAVRADLRSARAHVELALMLLRRGRETGSALHRLYADDAVRAAAAIAPDDADVAMVEAMTMLDQHRFRAAAERAGALIAARGDDPTGHLLLGDARLELGDYDGAIEAYQSAMNLRPDLRSYNRAAHMRWLMGDIDGAVELLELAIDSGSSRDPESIAWCWVDLGDIFVERGRAREAAAAADRALGLVADYPPGLALRARAFAMQGRVDDAVAALELATDRKPDVAGILHLSDLLDRAGRTDEAARRRAQAEALADGDPRPLAHELARRGQHVDRALALAQSELNERETIGTLDTWALALVRAGRLDEAEHALAKAMRLGTPDADLHLHRALVWLGRAERAEAEGALARALELDPSADPLLVEEIRTRLERA